MSLEPKTIEPLTRTLQAFSWRSVGGVPGLFEVWEDDHGRSEILVPTNPNKADFTVLLGRAYEQLQSLLGEKGARYLAAEELSLTSSLDLSRWHKESDLPNGVIRWPVGERHFLAVRAALSASAKSTRSPRKYHGNGGAFIASAFLEETLMGQTQIGSFVVTAHVPSNAVIPTTRSSAEKLDRRERGAETISTAAILDKLETALATAQEGLSEYKRRPNLDAFDGAEEEGLSHELAKALADLARDGECAVQVEREGDLVLPNRKSEFTFSAPDAAVFDSLATRLVQDMEPREVVLRGDVTLLSKEQELGDQVRTIRLNVEGEPGVRKARVRLSPEQYRHALAAHGDDLQLQVRGRLEREGNLYWLYDPRDVAVIELPNPFASLEAERHDQQRLFDE
ncbi:hypothetical protein [Cellulosimicrobium sp. JZ28]|uniref:hypothetical protein n=1 Tax=Cellulosimicrobium sp. JZ28 TaxID=1906273 RepID=UPI00188AE383|nr:hypothetical protein [Cellulosimicrobium sp. JZ28]